MDKFEMISKNIIINTSATHCHTSVMLHKNTAMLYKPAVSLYVTQPNPAPPPTVIIQRQHRC